MKIPFISNLKKPACASKRDMLELATLRYIEVYAYLLQPIQLLLIFVWFTAKKHFNIISTFFYSRITQRTKMINGKSKWMDIGLNRIRSTTKIKVIGNCCWEIKGRNRQRQKFNVGTISQRPRFAYIKSVRAANRC